jgi:Calcineurin-like phosphoesterase
LQFASGPRRPFRTRLVQDARARSAHLGPVAAILVSGDIAYKGLKEEYDAAYVWLVELAGACGCPLERIYVIPGNHDVNRVEARDNQSVRNVHRAIAGAAPDQRERELHEQFRHPETGRALMEPIAEYNKFAARFICQVYTPDKLFWHQDLPLDDHTTLRSYGLTSTLLPGAGGLNDTKLSLYLSPLQTVLDPVDGVVNLVMCHHPPDWLMDQDAVEDAVCGRAMLQFFGHKHRLRIDTDPHYVRFSGRRSESRPKRIRLGTQRAGSHAIRRMPCCSLSTFLREARRLLHIVTRLSILCSLWQGKLRPLI